MCTDTCVLIILIYKENNMRNKLTTKLSTRVTMSIAEVVCKVWQFGRSKLRGHVNDFDYHITDLRQQYPNQIVYADAVASLPFYCKTVEVDDEFERSSSIKIGDCNITYTFDKLVKRGDVPSNVTDLFDTRPQMIKNLITQTQIRHNKPNSLKVINYKRKGDNVVDMYSK